MEKSSVINFLESSFNLLYRIVYLVLPYGAKVGYKLKYGGGSFTDGKKIEVGLPEFYVDGAVKSIERKFDRTEAFCDLEASTLHECGHILYSNFVLFVDFQKKIATKLEAKGIRRDIGMKVASQLLNCTEDGRIEKRVVNRFPGALKYFQFSNGVVWDLPLKDMRVRKIEVKDGKFMEKSELADFMDSVVSISVTGLYPKGFKEFYKGQKIEEVMRSIRPDIIEAINTPTAKSCARKTEEIYDKIEDYLVELLKEAQKQQEAFEEFMNSLSSTPDFGNTEEMEQGEGELDEDATSVHLTPEEGSGSGSGKTKGKGSEGKEKGEGEEEEKKEGEGKGKGNPSESEAESEEGPGYSGIHDYAGESMKGSGGSMRGQTRTKDLSPEEIAKAEEEAQKKAEEEAKKSVEDAINKAKEDAEKQMKEPEKTSSSKKEKGEMPSPEEISKELEKDYGRESLRSFHEIPRNFSLVGLPSELKPTALKFRKEVEKFFKTQQGRNLHKMNSGSLTPKDLHRVGMGEYNVFTRKGHPSETNAVVQICWDGSGSMSGQNKQKYSAEACAIIEEGLKGIVPLKIINFSTDYSRGAVIHYLVKDFDENSRDKNYSISYGRSKHFGGGNKDGYDIRVCSKELLARPEKDKILIVLSDGIPTDYNYIVPEDDVKAAVKEARDAGIYVVSMFFGDERFRESYQKNYEYMYQKNLINSSPAELPGRLVKVLRKLVLR